MSKLLHLFSAVPFADDSAANVKIHIVTPEPRMGTLHEQIDHQWDQARRLHETLVSSLPQGVTDKLFAIMAETHAMHFKYSMQRLSEMSKDAEPA